MNAAIIIREPQVLKWVPHENETIRLLYASRSAAVSAHCLIWIARSPIEPLHFGDFSFFHYTAIGIRIRRFLLSELGGPVTFLIARWNWHSGCHLSSEAFQSDANCRYSANLPFHCVWLQWNTSSHRAQENWSIVYRFFSSNCIKMSFCCQGLNAGGTAIRCFGPDIVWAGARMRNARGKLDLLSK